MYKILKYALGVILTISGLATIFQGSFVGGSLVALGGLSIIPPISETNKAKYPFWRNKYLRRLVTVLVLIVGFIISGNQIESDNTHSKVEQVKKSNPNNEPQQKLETEENKLEEVRTNIKNEVRLIDLGKVSFDANENKIEPDNNDVTYKVLEVLRHKREETPMSKHNFENIDLLIETSSYKKEDLEIIALRLKDEHSDFTPNNCNLSLWDIKKAYQLEEQRQDYEDELYAKANEQIDLKTAYQKVDNLLKQWDKKHYVFVADHFIGWIALGTDFFQYYPYQNDHYNKLGGKNYKK